MERTVYKRRREKDGDIEKQLVFQNNKRKFMTCNKQQVPSQEYDNNFKFVWMVD